MAVQLGTSINALDRVSTALAAAGATATPATPLDLGPQKGRNQPFLKLQVSVPATPDLVEAKTLIFNVTDCDTSGGSYAAVAAMSAIMTVTGAAAAAGGPASSILLPVPDHMRRFVKVTCVVLAAAGDNTGVSYVMEVVKDHQG